MPGPYIGDEAGRGAVAFLIHSNSQIQTKKSYAENKFKFHIFEMFKLLFLWGLLETNPVTTRLSNIQKIVFRKSHKREARFFAHCAAGRACHFECPRCVTEIEVCS